jgi:hypothetical protein
MTCTCSTTRVRLAMREDLMRLAEAINRLDDDIPLEALRDAVRTLDTRVGVLEDTVRDHEQRLAVLEGS